MTALEEKLVEYIDDAYAMEQNVLRMLDGLIGTTKDPQMKRALERHKKETESKPSGSRNVCTNTVHRRQRRRKPAA